MHQKILRRAVVLYQFLEYLVMMNLDDLYLHWRAFKHFFQFADFLSPLALHFVFGTTGFIFFYVILRKQRWAGIFAWCSVLALQIVNECIDIFFSVTRYNDIYVKNTILDFVVTMIIPSIFLVILHLKQMSTKSD